MKGIIMAKQPTRIGPAVISKITRNLQDFGYPVTREEVAQELAKPESERDVIGMFAAGMLEENGVTDWIVDDERGEQNG
jgi:hypothetical protein